MMRHRDRPADESHRICWRQHRRCLYQWTHVLCVVYFASSRAVATNTNEPLAPTACLVACYSTDEQPFCVQHSLALSMIIVTGKLVAWSAVLAKADSFTMTYVWHPKIDPPPLEADGSREGSAHGRRFADTTTHETCYGCRHIACVVQLQTCRPTGGNSTQR
jgi:hypothetical protein